MTHTQCFLACFFDPLLAHRRYKLAQKTTQKTDPMGDLLLVKKRRKTTQRRRFYGSRLDTHRTYIEAQRRAGASFEDIALSLRLFHQMRVSPTTVWRATQLWNA